MHDPSRGGNNQGTVENFLKSKECFDAHVSGCMAAAALLELLTLTALLWDNNSPGYLLRSTSKNVGQEATGTLPLMLCRSIGVERLNGARLYDNFILDILGEMIYNGLTLQEVLLYTDTSSKYSQTVYGTRKPTTVP